MLPPILFSAFVFRERVTFCFHAHALQATTTRVEFLVFSLSMLKRYNGRLLFLKSFYECGKSSVLLLRSKEISDDTAHFKTMSSVFSLLKTTHNFALSDVDAHSLL